LHARIYGHSTRASARIVNLRSIQQAGGLDRLDDGANMPVGGTPEKGTRLVLVADSPEYVPAKVYDRALMAVGFTFHGPAIVEQPDTTTLIEPGWNGRVDHAGNLILERREH
jgi:N-methylhydantoinase A